MHSALRKMGNSTGLIVPKTVLREAGVASGTTLDLIVENGRIVATPVPSVRTGWAEAAALITADPNPADEAAWRGFANADDANLTW